MTRIRVAHVALDARSGGSEAIYTYQDSLGAQVGEAYFVPLGSRSVLGYVIKLQEVRENDLGFPFAKLRPLGMRVKGLELPLSTLQLVEYISQEYLCSFCQVLSLAIPPGIRERITPLWRLTGKSSKEPLLSVAQQEVIQILLELGGQLVETKTKTFPEHIRKTLQQLVKLGFVKKELTLETFRERHKVAEVLQLTADLNKVESFLKKEAQRKPAQAMVLMCLQEASGTSFTSQEIRALSGATEQTLRALLRAGLLEPANIDATASKEPPALNRHQTAALADLSKAIQAHTYQPFLLFGVTGSGKTEVYLRAAAETLRQGRQVLYLVPEIALTAQVIAQLRDRFGKNIAVLHSMLSPRERLETWTRIKNSEVPIVLGARSALFAPLQNIGLIIMDEEHESSYKQDSSPRYHTKQTAIFLAKHFQATLILGSATPSIETFYEAQQGDLTLLELPERAAQATLPRIHIEDLTEVYKKTKPALFTDQLHTKICETLDRKEQVILFLNRRAYAPFLMCRDCGQMFTCVHCAVSLSYHRAAKCLKCHHCGYQILPPDTCPKCSGSRIKPFGVGVEKVQEAMEELFPGAKVARLDRDVAKNKGSVEETFALFRAGEIQVLVGTQMIAKGLDFPNVTLVGVIAADISLSIPDFRSSERTFQLLSQVAGRAGRGGLPGEVVIQTFNPHHPALLHCQQHDYMSFYRSSCEERLQVGYPPHKRLVNIILSGEDLQKVKVASSQLAVLLRDKNQEMQLLGPANCPLERLQGKWRRHILLKLAPQVSVEWLGQAMRTFDPQGVEWIVDVDPYTLM